LSPKVRKVGKVRKKKVGKEVILCDFTDLRMISQITFGGFHRPDNYWDEDDFTDYYLGDFTDLRMISPISLKLAL
jgi:hypothetical protein